MSVLVHAIPTANADVQSKIAFRTRSVVVSKPCQQPSAVTWATLWLYWPDACGLKPWMAWREICRRLHSLNECPQLGAILSILLPIEGSALHASSSFLILMKYAFATSYALQQMAVLGAAVTTRAFIPLKNPFAPSLLHIIPAPSTAICWSAYEVAKAYFIRVKNEEEA